MSTIIIIKTTPVATIPHKDKVVITTMKYCVVESKILNATIKTNLFLS